MDAIFGSFPQLQSNTLTNFHEITVFCTKADQGLFNICFISLPFFKYGLLMGIFRSYGQKSFPIVIQFIINVPLLKR